MTSFSIWIFACLTVLFAGIIQTLTGFGFALVAVPFLMMLFPIQQAVLINIILCLFIMILQGIGIRALVNWRFVYLLVLIGMPGLMGGIVLADILDPVIIKGIIGAVLIVYVTFQWIQMEKQKKEAHLHMRDTGTVDFRDCEGTNTYPIPKGFYLAGITSGLLTGMAGMPGPPVVAILVNALPKEKFHATIIWYFLFECIFAILAFLFMQHMGEWVLVFRDALIFSVPTAIGFLIGVPIRKLLSETYFKRLVFGLLLIVGFTFSWGTLHMFI